MVTWYKHDIPAWMDATENLDDRSYRVLHVVCQLIYLNEGPIRVNEAGIAGRCNMHISAFRRCLDLLVTSGQLTLNPDGTLGQHRANLELEAIGTNRVHAGLGGRAARKSLKNNNPIEAPLQKDRSLKTRLEKTRQEKKTTNVVPLVAPAPQASPPIPKTPESQPSNRKPKKNPWPPGYSLAEADEFGEGGYAASSGFDAWEAGNEFSRFKNRSLTEERWMFSPDWRASWQGYIDMRAGYRYKDSKKPQFSGKIEERVWGEDGMQRFGKDAREILAERAARAAADPYGD